MPQEQGNIQQAQHDKAHFLYDTRQVAKGEQKGNSEKENEKNQYSLKIPDTSEGKRDEQKRTANDGKKLDFLTIFGKRHAIELMKSQKSDAKDQQVENHGAGIDDKKHQQRKSNQSR